MATDTHIPTGQEIYDALMSQIDTDLVSTTVYRLEELYKGESESARAARFHRYEDSYSKYDEAFREWSGKLHRMVGHARHDALKSAEAKSHQDESIMLASLESQMSS